MDNKTSKSKVNCCVPQCSSTYKNSNWVVVLRMGKKISPYMKVCSLHFKNDDFFFKAHVNNLPRLKKNVVPSLNLPTRSHDIIKNRHYQKMREERLRKRRQLVHREAKENDLQLQYKEDKKPIDEATKQAAENILLFNKKEVVFKKTFEDKGVQVNTYEECNDYNVVDTISSDFKCKVLTGVVNLTIFNILVCAISKMTHKKSHICDKNKVLLTLMKLKLNLPFNALGVLFKISAKSVHTYFCETLENLSVILKPVIRFPPKEEILSNMPICFQNYKNTRHILDCTEITIEKSVVPSGLITYVSNGYGGRMSDKAIFNSENIIAKLDPGDAIMVDKGILIKNECQQHFIKLIRPPYLRNRTQFSKEDAQTTASIAKARVHVERAIQRIKIFRICKGTILWTLLPYMDSIMIIIAGLTNLSPPILANSKFQK
ncbi:hypothetical protein RN001_001178 [Aquatica leii]|uniref:THAP-type domain-containing protein n=1 Tax=Aquatica leii TaxID=1421715 RepID=A0AAN7PFS9_9COLE|nr:hypothetical protein RN001_001178 [Aquatica leii]